MAETSEGLLVAGVVASVSAHVLLFLMMIGTGSTRRDWFFNPVWEANIQVSWMLVVLTALALLFFAAHVVVKHISARKG